MAESNPRSEKIQVVADQLLATVRKLLKDGSVRRIVIRDETGRERVSIPMNLGAGVGALALVINPVLTLLAGAAAAVGARMTEYTVEIERTDVPSSAPIDVEAADPLDERSPGEGDPSAL